MEDYVMQNEKTEELISQIKNSTNVSQFINKYDESFSDINFTNYVKLIIQKKGLKKSKVIKKAGLHRTYAYQILSGHKRPSRDKVLRFSFGLELDLNETQQLLKVAQYSTLYPKNKRDAIIIYCKCYGYNLITTNELLYNNEEVIIE